MKKMFFALAVVLLAFQVSYGQNYNHVTVIDTNFDNNSLGGWTARSDSSRGLGNKVELDRNIKASGAASMRVFDRTFTWMGAIHKLTDNAVPGDIYSMTAKIYFQGGPATGAFTFSMERAYNNRGNTYDNIQTFQARRGQWTEISAEFAIPTDPSQTGIWIYFELPWKQEGQTNDNDRIDFWLDDVKVIKLDPASRPTAEINIPNLRDSWSRYFDVGAAAGINHIDPNSQYAQLLIKHFSVLVAENEHKWNAIQPQEGQFNWTQADRIIEFAENTGMRVRWHALVWHEQMPDWLFQDRRNASRPAARNLLNDRMKTHIQTVVRRYRNRVDCYDVVNEALADNGGDRNGLRTAAQGSKWYEILGPEYIDNAFRWAREVDPNARLVINDYNLESSAYKRNNMAGLIRGMKERGVPVDAVGLQMHISVSQPPVEEIRQTIELFGSLGVKVIITEMDMSIYGGDREPLKEVTPQILLAQAQRYRDIWAVFVEQAEKGNLGDMVLLWGTTDNMSWKNNFPVRGRTDAPLLFDSRYKAKPAFWALTDPRRVQGLR